jgi:hypothetical protein
VAWDFGAEIHALTGFDADSTSATESAETFQVHTNKWLTDAAKEVINLLPPHLLKLCSATRTFTSTATNGETETLNTGKILSVFGGEKKARLISEELKFEADSDASIHKASETDPVYYIQSNKINVLPEDVACRYDEVVYPSISYNDVSIDAFPDEAEHLVTLRAAISAAEYQLAIEQDAELYTPIIQLLKSQYQEGIMALKTGNMAQQPQ